MSLSSDFLNHCSQILNANVGTRAGDVINKALAKKKISDSSSISDLEEFIDIIETSIGKMAGKKNATIICKQLRDKVTEVHLVSQTTELRNDLSAEAQGLDINEFLAKIHAPDISMIRRDPAPPEAKPAETAEKAVQPEQPVQADIDEFTTKTVLPAENEIRAQSSAMAKKYGLDPEKVIKDVIEKVRVNVRNEIDKKIVKSEINKFLFRFPIPAKTDVDDFVGYVKLFKLNITEAALREQIETERLYRKFQDNIPMDKNTEIDLLMNTIKAYSDRNDIAKALEEKGFAYLIKDETGVSDKLLFSLVERIIQVEKDSLGGIYLEHMVKKTYL